MSGSCNYAMQYPVCVAHPDYSELLPELVGICIWFQSICALRGFVGFVLLLQLTQDVVCRIQQLLCRHITQAHPKQSQGCSLATQAHPKQSQGHSLATLK